MPLENLTFIIDCSAPNGVPFIVKNTLSVISALSKVKETALPSTSTVIKFYNCLGFTIKLKLMPNRITTPLPLLPFAQKALNSCGDKYAV